MKPTVSQREEAKSFFFLRLNFFFGFMMHQVHSLDSAVVQADFLHLLVHHNGTGNAQECLLSRCHLAQRLTLNNSNLSKDFWRMRTKSSLKNTTNLSYL